MTSTQIWTNIIAYVLQIGLLVGIGAALPALLRLKAPGARLLYWQVLLIACLALPWMRPWQSDVFALSNAAMTTAPVAMHVATSTATRSAIPPVTVIALWVLAAGVAVRLVWLALGLLKLARYRRHGHATPLPPEWRGATADTQLLLSDQVSGPVTFGFFQPVVLLPANFPSMSQTMRDAILFHELLHVERNDWLFTLGEELVRAVFWFHPAIWWVLGEIQLAREQTVDRAVIEMTQARDPYVDTLLAMAGVTPELDLAPAPLFLRRRHLKQRVMGIVQEVRMSKTRMLFAQIAALSTMAVACWFVTGAIPLHAQAQMVADGVGITVNLNGSQLMHRSPVMYPADALAKGVEGTVVVQVRLDANGEVIDDAVLSGPDELRKGVQQSVLSWHFDRSAGSATRVVNIDFVKPANPNAGTAPPAAIRAQIVGATPIPGGRGGGTAAIVQTQQQTDQAAVTGFIQDLLSKAEQQQTQAPSAEGAATVNDLKAKLQLAQANSQRLQGQPDLNGTIERIEVDGLSDSAKTQLLAQLPVHAGDPHSQENMTQLREAARQFDEHLTVTGSTPGGSGAWVVRIQTPDAPAPARVPLPAFVPSNIPPGAQRIGGNVQASKLISQTKPVYPPLAKMARQQGTVSFQAIIGTNGSVQDLSLISGPPLLVLAAHDAVMTWAYAPTLLNGTPVVVATTIDVSFILAP
jgi:beta-lactamase regulating signal transducer with metallopeptidase domain/outer membrane biosynthesis protein TonB